jgi:cytochrome b
MPSDKLQAYAVWDIPTRWFHWINALAIIGLIAVGLIILNDEVLGISNEGKVLLKTVHVWVGYVFALNLVVRLVWAFFGNRYARWQAILPGGPGYVTALRNYTKAFLAGNPQSYLGHNPAARISVASLLLLLTMQAISGLMLASTDIYYPPFGHWIAQWIAAPGIDPSTLMPYAKDMMDPVAYQAMRDFRAPFIVVHEYGFYALLALIGVHIAAVVITELREGGGLVSAMFTGRKVFSHEPEDAEPHGSE